MIHTKIKTIAAALLALLLLVCSGALNTRAVAFAATDENESDGTDILKDLYTDSDFDINDYPIIEDDYKLTVVQLAESKQGELLLYVYQPCASVRKLYATSINMSLQDRGDKNATWDIYELELLSVYDVFAKYRVADFELKADEERYYNIASIFRIWQKDIDEGLEKYMHNNITEVAFRVAQCWTVYQDGDTVQYDMAASEVVTVTEQVINKIRVGIQSMPDWATVYMFTNAWAGADCFYLAFNTDRPIDKLIEADITYDIKHYVPIFDDIKDAAVQGILQAFGKETNANLINRKKPIRHTGVQTIEISAFKKSHSYSFKDRIMSVEDFVSAEKTLSEDALRELVGKQWVVRFDELAYEERLIFGVPYYSENKVTNTTLLGLEFETDGQHYNLGVVDNKQSTSVWKPPAKEDILKPNGGFNFFKYVWQCIVKLFNGTANFFEGFVAVTAILVCTFLLGLILFALSIILPPVRIALKGIWWFITLPFRGIAALFKKRKNKEKRKNGSRSSSKKKRRG